MAGRAATFDSYLNVGQMVMSYIYNAHLTLPQCVHLNNAYTKFFDGDVVTCSEPHCLFATACKVFHSFPLPTPNQFISSKNPFIMREFETKNIYLNTFSKNLFSCSQRYNRENKPF